MTCQHLVVARQKMIKIAIKRVAGQLLSCIGMISKNYHIHRAKRKSYFEVHVKSNWLVELYINNYISRSHGFQRLINST
jgi:hypothetical protein